MVRLQQLSSSWTLIGITLAAEIFFFLAVAIPYESRVLFSAAYKPSLHLSDLFRRPLQVHPGRFSNLPLSMPGISLFQIVSLGH